MPSNATRPKWLFFAIISLSITALSACAEYPERLWLEAPGWSRATLISETTVRNAVRPAISLDGTYFFLVVQNENGGNSPKLIALDGKANLLWESLLPFFSVDRVEDPRIVIQGDYLLALWVENDILYGINIGFDGRPTSEVSYLSGGHQVDSYEVAADSNGNIAIWFSGPRSQPGLYLYDDARGIVRVDPKGFNPSLQIDNQGSLHAVWLRNVPGESEHRFMYAYYPKGEVVEGREHYVHSINIPTSSGLYGPVLGLDEKTVYLFWSIVTRTGPSAGAVQASLTSMQYGAERVTQSASRFRFPNGYDLIYSPVSSQIQAGERALVDTQVATPVSRLADLSPNGQSLSEMLVAFRVRLPFLRNKEASQAGLAFLSDGVVKSVQLLSFTPSESTLPTVQTDRNGYVYATWLEGAQPGPYRVYFAGTSPQLVAEMNTLEVQDYVELGAEIGFGLLSGLVLIPFPLAWGLIPALFILFTGRFRRESEPFASRGTLITLAIAFILYWISKLTTLSGISTYVPFSAWLPFLTEGWYLPLRIGVPVLTTLLALYIAWRTTYHRERNVPLFFILMFAVVDGLISISIYGVIFYNAI